MVQLEKMEKYHWEYLLVLPDSKCKQKKNKSLIEDYTILPYNGSKEFHLTHHAPKKKKNFPPTFAQQQK